MDYPNNLPCPNIGMKVTISFSNVVFRGQGKPKRRPIAQPLSVIELNFFMSESDLENWNEFYYKTLKNGTLEFNVDWDFISKIKFYGKPKVKPIGNKYFTLSIVGVVFNSVLDDLVDMWKINACQMIDCIKNGIKG